MKVVKRKRLIDKLAQENYSWWKKTFISIKKTEVKTWKRIFIVAFISGAIFAIIWSVAFHWHNSSDAKGMSSLRLDPANLTVKKDDVFKVSAILDTQGNDAVVVKAQLKYDKDSFELQGWDTGSSDFVKKNKCLDAGKKCKIVDNRPNDGIISITLAKPTPGVNSHADTVATFRFKALKDAVEGEKNITLNYSPGSSSGSDVVTDDKRGTNILSGVKNATVAFATPTCETFTYYNWSACNAAGKQTRGILLSSPLGCKGGNPVLEQACTPPSEVNNKEITPPIACTQEMKQCPDGSFVSRQASNCQFAPCPETTANTTGTPANQ